MERSRKRGLASEDRARCRCHTPRKSCMRTKAERDSYVDRLAAQDMKVDLAVRMTAPGIDCIDLDYIELSW